MKRWLISIAIDMGPYKEFLDKLIKMTGQGSSYTCVANVHMLVEAYKDASFARVVNNADMVTPDGMPLCFGLKLFHGIKQPRVAGMDLLPDLLQEASEKSVPVYFYGGTEEMLSRTREQVGINFPKLILAGTYSPPYLPTTSTFHASDEDVERINKSGAKLIFVVLGCPKQEKWMASAKGKVNGSMIGIGGALPVLIGMRKKAPKWVQDHSLEWLFRLCLEPRRLFKRYMYTNSIFIKLLINERIRYSKRRGKPALKEKENFLWKI